MELVTGSWPWWRRFHASGNTGVCRWIRVALGLLLLGCSLWLDAEADAQYLSMSLSPSTISFSSADPDATPVLTASSVTVTYVVLFSFGENWAITLQADDDLRNGTATIQASKITWTASPSPPFQSGTLSTTAARTLASGSGDVWSSGAVAFSLPNSWTYDVGTYSATITFTLACP
jgi:hypothetical protein